MDLNGGKGRQMTTNTTSLRDIVDIDELKKLFEAFSTATGFTTGLVDATANEILIATGWRDICVKFHRANTESSKICKLSGRILTDGLNNPGEIRIHHCQNGLVDGCAPIIIEGRHLANLATGQIFFEPPDINRFKEQARQYGYDEQAYLAAVSEVPIVSEETFRAMLSFLSHLATTVANIGLSKLQSQRDHHNNEKLMKQLHTAQKMEAIGMMAGGVAHDLNNVLSGIIAYPDLILLKIPKGHEIEKDIKMIKEAGHRAARIASDLLTISRGAIFKKEISNLNTLITTYFHSPEFFKLSSLYPHVIIHKNLGHNLKNFNCSPVHIIKCLMNLISNGAEAIVSKGNITITTENIKITESSKNPNLQEGDYILLSITDDGPGIPKESIPHIFEPFYTKKKMGRSGTGLGLAIVWNTIQDHNGKIIVKSNDQGTSFNLYFPATNEKIASHQTTETSISDLLGDRQRVLVVDDDKHQREIACEILTNLNYNPTSVESGENALKYLADNPTPLIILDMLMDPGINGLTTYKQILKKYPDQKAIIVSGYAEEELIQKSKNLGIKQFISKPYTIAQLGKAIKEALTD